MKEPTVTMKQLPPQMQPYEKCISYGPQFLTDAELIASIIRSGSKEYTSVALADHLLDLRKANLMTFLHAGIPRKQILVTDVCTCCNPDILFSHRASNGMRGNLGAFLSLV